MEIKYLQNKVVSVLIEIVALMNSLYAEDKKEEITPIFGQIILHLKFRIIICVEDINGM